MDKLRDNKIPSLKTYNNWPSKEAVILNRKIFESQKCSVDKLSPRNKVVRDPISLQVDRNRLRERANSTLKSSAIKLEWKSHQNGLRPTI
jgi:hypothetical protein